MPCRIDCFGGQNDAHAELGPSDFATHPEQLDKRSHGRADAGENCWLGSRSAARHEVAHDTYALSVSVRPRRCEGEVRRRIQCRQSGHYRLLAAHRPPAAADPLQPAAAFSASDRSAWNLTFARAVENVSDGDSGRSNVASIAWERIPADRLHPKTVYSHCRPVAAVRGSPNQPVSHAWDHRVWRPGS